MRRFPLVPREPALRFLRVFLTMAGALVACGDDQALLAERYDQTCTSSEECIPVVVGNVCTCDCEMAAVSAHERDRYAADLAAIDCGDHNTLGTVGCGPCREVAVACRDGLCRVLLP